MPGIGNPAAEIKRLELGQRLQLGQRLPKYLIGSDVAWLLDAAHKQEYPQRRAQPSE